MQITLNGESKEIHAKSVAALVAELALNPTQKGMFDKSVEAVKSLCAAVKL